MPSANEAAYRYFLSMVGKNLSSNAMGVKAQSAIILQKAGRTAEANEFIASIKEHLVQTDERGAYLLSMKDLSLGNTTYFRSCGGNGSPEDGRRQ